MIARLTLTGHGAAPWMTILSVDTSAASRTSSGRRSRRWNMVGTMCTWVTPCRSISARVSSGVQRSMRMVVAP